MTIKELIKQLQEYDDRNEIKVEVIDGGIHFSGRNYFNIKRIDLNEGEIFIELEEE